MRPLTWANAGIHWPSTPSRAMRESVSTGRWPRSGTGTARVHRHRPGRRPATTAALRPARARSANAGLAPVDCWPSWKTGRTPGRCHRAASRPRWRPGSRGAGEAHGQRFRLGLAIELFLEALQQAVADPAHHQRGAVEALHHFLDTEILGIVFEAQARGQGLLVIEAQPFFRAARDRCRPKRSRASTARSRFSAAASSAPRWPRPTSASRSRTPKARSAIQPSVLRSRRPPGPSEIRLQVVGSVAEALVAVAQLFQLGQEEGTRRPQLTVVDGLAQRTARRIIGQDRTRLDQRGQHGLVSRRLAALQCRTHRMADRQSAVPQQREQACQCRFMRPLCGRVAEHQQVDVRTRKQFTRP